MNFQKRDELAKDIYVSLINQTYNKHHASHLGMPDLESHFNDLTRYSKEAASAFFKDAKKPEHKK